MLQSWFQFAELFMVTFHLVELVSVSKWHWSLFKYNIYKINKNVSKYFELRDRNDIIYNIYDLTIFACIFVTGGFSGAVETYKLCYGKTLQFPYEENMTDSRNTIYFTPENGGQASRTVIFREGKVKSLWCRCLFVFVFFAVNTDGWFITRVPLMSTDSANAPACFSEIFFDLFERCKRRRSRNVFHSQKW